MRMISKAKQSWKNISDYVRYDLKEIAFPSSLPDPPSIKPKRRKLTFQDHLHVWRTAGKLYVQSWRTHDIDFDEEGNIKKPEEEADKKRQEKKDASEPSMVEDLAVAARMGAENVKPALQRLYMTRATVYRDALKNFVQGYQEGVAETMASKKSASSTTQSDDAICSNNGTSSKDSNL